MMKSYAILGSKRLDIHTANLQMKKVRKGEIYMAKHHFDKMKVGAQDSRSQVFTVPKISYK